MHAFLKKKQRGTTRQHNKDNTTREREKTDTEDRPKAQKQEGNNNNNGITNESWLCKEC